MLRELDRIKGDFGPEVATRRRDLIRLLCGVDFARAADLTTFHEALCFARAYPDDAQTLTLTDQALADFAKRRDVKQLQDELWDTGIAGTNTWYAFYWATAHWLVARWPDRMQIDWQEFANHEQLIALLQLLLPYSETPGLDEIDHTAEQWLDFLKGPDESDAEFLVHRVDALALDEFGKEALYDALNVPMKLIGKKGTPSRSTARWPQAKIHYQESPLDRTRPDLLQDIARPPVSVRKVSAKHGQELIDLTKISMLTRSRDLDAFCNADAHDVRIIDCGDGLSFALMGVRPERRLMLESSYGMLTLKNGMPIGYVLLSAVFGSAAIAYNVFDTFRGGEAARILGRVLAVAHHLLGADAFSIDPYQLGHNNDEGLRSGAWWFYQKLGFRPADRGIERRMQRELKRMRKDRGYRSDLDTMRELVVDHMFLHLDEVRDDVLGKIGAGNIGIAISARLAKRFGKDREAGIEQCAQEAAELCGDGPDKTWSKSEKLWWRRWSPLLLAVPGIRRWQAKDLLAAVQVVRAKGGKQESEFVHRLNAHGKLRRALANMAQEE